MSIIEKPRWLEDYPDIKKCLQEFINRLENKPATDRVRKTIPYAANRKNFPSLWEQTTESDNQWQLIRELQDSFGICEIRLNKKRDPLDAEYKNASIRLFCSAENTVRLWLNRPFEEPLLQQWRQVVGQYQLSFPGSTERLASRVFTLGDKSIEEIVKAFVNLGKYQAESLTLRQLSAKCFWGLSKTLDNQEELVRSLYPDIAIKPRSLMINLHYPDIGDDAVIACLFIENQDTYINALQGDIPITRNYILVYCSGFLGSASRIRTRESVVFHWSSTSTLDKRVLFEDWWLRQSNMDFPVFFWGDLDYSGMAILGALKNVFTKIEAWKPGYNKMLEALERNIAHKADISGKQNQDDPLATGCDYADKILLPILRDKLLFVDQEII